MCAPGAINTPVLLVPRIEALLALVTPALSCQVPREVSGVFYSRSRHGWFGLSGTKQRCASHS